MLFGKRFDERIEQLEKHFEPKPERGAPGPPEEFLDAAWWAELRAMVGEEDEGNLARLAEIREFVQRELNAYSDGKPWRECAKDIDSFMLPERQALDHHRWEENSLRQLGYVPGVNCEDCGCAGTRDEPCKHCGGYVSWHGFLYKRVFSVEKLEREIAASYSLSQAGYGGNPATLEGILRRRLAEG